MVLEGLLAPQECDELRRRMEEIVEEMDVPEHCRTVFSTYHDEQTKTQVTELRVDLQCPRCGMVAWFHPLFLLSFSHVLSYLSGFKMQVGVPPLCPQKPCPAVHLHYDQFKGLVRDT